MSADRRYSQYQWSGVAQPYINTGTAYPSGGYSSTTDHHSPTSAHAAYPDEPRYTQGYYSNSPAPHSPSSPVYASPISPSGSDVSNYHSSRYLDQPRSSSTRPHSHQTSYTHSQSYTYSTSPTSHHPTDSAYTRPRSHSQAYPEPETISLSPPTHYQQIPLSPAVPISSQFPSGSSRPFACDLCALSFNRQHDLKRHRETHTGEKPFLCNGGCGKTFTRKDALKRHQLVKGCGNVEESRS
ncbi:hypothetical protein FA15DRAFT_670248 [Coprinopsis marcescibilis]|uniref:C2H2-type domain-containing protein n=1 Tax=Coprinopsis marcescibilis TaxID=230819 RepID=A0A5C3KTY0_COPMA|nr:hypothetical protein FA15DRAFT_670248 [Coprinopsis marcescibilis]